MYVMNELDANRAYMIIEARIKTLDQKFLCTKEDFFEKVETNRKELYYRFRPALYYAIVSTVEEFSKKAFPKRGSCIIRDDAAGFAQQVFLQLSYRKFVPDEKRPVLGWLQRQNIKVKATKAGKQLSSVNPSRFILIFYPTFFAILYIFSLEPKMLVLSLVCTVMFSTMFLLFAENYRRDLRILRWYLLVLLGSLFGRILTHFAF